MYKKILIASLIILLSIQTIISNKGYVPIKIPDTYYYSKCITFLKQEEGLSLKPYKCTSGKLTIGYGHRLLKGEYAKYRNGITKKQADDILIEDFASAINDVKLSFDKEKDDKYIYIYAVLCFQTGKRGFEEFDDFISAVEFSKGNSDPDSKLGIYYALKDSKLNKQTPNRVNRYINLIVANCN